MCLRNFIKVHREDPKIKNKSINKFLISGVFSALMVGQVPPARICFFFL